VLITEHGARVEQQPPSVYYAAMLINQLLSGDREFYFAWVLTLIISIVLHELAHGWAAISRGDQTPVWLNRMTPNPIVHMGGLSLILLFVVGIAWGQMPVDPTRMRGRYAHAFVAFAGPLMNIALAFVSLSALALMMAFGSASFMDPDNQVFRRLFLLLNVFGTVNIALFIFNLIPIPPLDGSAILADFSREYRNLIARPEIQGAMLAVSVILFVVAGRYIFPAAMKVSQEYLELVLRVIR
jgi:Zn-dependent protease